MSITDRARNRVLATQIWAPADASRRYPLIVFGHGLGVAPIIYERLLATWAAAGYVVAAPKFPGTRTDAVGGVNSNDFPNQPADMLAVVDHMIREPHVNGDRIGIAGQSMGAMTALNVAANTCCRDERVDSAVLLAGAAHSVGSGRFFPGNRGVPLLFVHGDADNIVSYASGRRSFVVSTSPSWLLTIDGGDHGGPYIRSPGEDAQARAVADVTIDFWDATLKAQEEAFDRMEPHAEDVGRLEKR